MAVGLPFSHIIGYVCSIFAIPALFSSRVWSSARKVIVAILAFLAYWTIRGMFTPKPSLSMLSLINLIAHWLLPFVLGILIARQIKLFFKLHFITLTFIIILSLLAAVGLFPQQIFGEKIWAEGMLWGFNHHNDFASLLAFFLPAFLVMGGSFNFLLELIFGLGLGLTGSRGYYIAFTLSSAGIFIQHFVRGAFSKRMMLNFLVAFFVFVGSVLLLSAPKTRIEKAVKGVDMAVIARLNRWKVAHWALSENPLFGIGPGQLQTRDDYISRIKRENLFIDFKAGDLKHLHNLYLTIMAEGGIIGIALVLLIFWTILSMLSKRGKIGKAFIWGFVAILVGSFFDEQLIKPPEAIDIFFVIGLLAGSNGVSSGYDESKT